MAKNYENPKILAFARDQECQACGSRAGTTVAAHSNQMRHGKSRGKKAHDCFVAYMCDLCHHQLDRGFLWSQPEKLLIWQRAHERSVPLFQHLLDARGAQLLKDDGYQFGEDVWGWGSDSSH